MKADDRQDGFYWTRWKRAHSGEPEVREWTGEVWACTGTWQSIPDGEIEVVSALLQAPTL